MRKNGRTDGWTDERCEDANCSLKQLLLEHRSKAKIRTTRETLNQKLGARAVYTSCSNEESVSCNRLYAGYQTPCKYESCLLTESESRRKPCINACISQKHAKGKTHYSIRWFSYTFQFQGQILSFWTSQSFQSMEIYRMFTSERVKYLFSIQVTCLYSREMLGFQTKTEYSRRMAWQLYLVQIKEILSVNEAF